MTTEWIRVSPKQPCPVCEKPDYCTMSKDGTLARCMRAESERESVGSDGSVGWIHRLSEPITVDVKAAQKVEKMPQSEVEALAKRFYEHERAKHIRAELSESLGVSEDSLDRLRVGYGVDYRGREFASFPSRNAQGKVIGIVRRFEVEGKKMTYPGTRNGIFYCLGWSRYPGHVLIVEGASDVAAGITEGLCVLGRSSNIGGVELVKKMVESKHCAGRTVVVVGEHDEKPENRGTIASCPSDCSGCLHCDPGRQGARIVADKLGCEWVMPPAGVKDFRAYSKSGMLWSELLRLNGKRGA